MTSLPHLQTQLREHFSELCEACFAEQEWLEDGRHFDPSTEKRNQPAMSSEHVGSATAKFKE